MYIYKPQDQPWATDEEEGKPQSINIYHSSITSSIKMLPGAS